MKLVEKINKILENAKVNYSVNAVLHFDDGINKGKIKVKATDAKEAEKLAREQLSKTWKDVQKIEIISVVKG